ncbi:TlpA family protein disulfide reductase [Adhaeribacter sp. BT258]|uniref:TlpA family protein disulfide reductase n=1 Tax=Adhaeribacter terrigena TaxID=2793070 RepID=A0ABS1BXJ9_9BACT|nr:TlpA disulfide reductase family protein [Adhaeribacter terrigena]MBK0401822.1 TlpA family protein disulfide reductase [Adhaeribacter terrigena]
MTKNKFSFRNIPGWVYTVVVFGFLYLSGLHTEAIGQVQRVLLATGIMQPDLPAIPASRSSINKSPETEVVPEAMLANDFLLQDLQGNMVKFSSLKNKVVFMNIWATWCPPCVAEMPGIQKLYDKLNGEKDIAFVMLSVDQNGMEKVKKFISKKGYTFPVYLPASNIPATFQTQSIPTTFILGKGGKVAARHDGMADYDSKEVKDYLEGLAK